MTSNYYILGLLADQMVIDRQNKALKNRRFAKAIAAKKLNK